MRMFRFLAGAVALLPVAVLASETISYGYDAKGRLIAVAHSGSINGGVTASYTYDAADNRSVYTVNVPTNPPANITVANNSFESPSTADYIYRPAITGASFTGNSGLASNGGAFAFTAPDGSQVAFLQTASSSPAVVGLLVTGLTAGGNYVVRFKRRQRPGFGGNAIAVSFGGAALGTFGGTATFEIATSAPFQASASTGTVTFTGEVDPSTDRTTGIDAIEVVPATTGAETVANNSFEQPSTGGTYIYRPSTTGATFTGNSGLTANGGAFGFTAPDAAQVAFLQTGSSLPAVVSLSVSGLTPGATYVFRFKRQQRPGFGGNAVALSFGGTALGTFGGTASFETATSTPFQATTATGTISFTGETDLNTDRATGIDAVEIIRTG